MKKRTLLRTLVVLVCSCVTLPHAHAATNLLANGDFESEPNWGGGVSHNGGYTALTGSQIPGWTIEPSHAVSVHISPGPYLVISNSFSVNTDGEGYNGHNANFYQDFGSTKDVSYALTFDWQSWGFIEVPTSNALKISVTDTVTSNALFVAFYYYDGNTPHSVHHVTTNFFGTGNVLRLRIEESPESGYNDNTFVVDNFSVVAELPQLRITVPAPFQVALSWPTNAADFTLETTFSLPASAWNIVTNVAVVFSNLFSVTVSATNGQQFFRLHRP